jgi:hypothetical protein
MKTHGGDTYSSGERQRASAWKQTTSALPDEARLPAQYVKKSGEAKGPAYSFCLPSQHAALTLLPEVRDEALALFVELGIPWHAGVAGGPSNHLLSSQVQCVNALGQMVTDPARIVQAFAGPLGTATVHQIEPARWLTFEYIGPGDLLNEAVNGKRVRGANCTSVDAAFVHTTTDGVRELVLLEWKYTESYRRRTPSPAQDAVRWKRYGELLMASDSPIDMTLLSFAELCQEPLYQLMRQQLLAHELEKMGAEGAERVRVVHVSPPANLAYQTSLFDVAAALGPTVSAVWKQLLLQPDRFVSLDSSILLNSAVTSEHYVQRYGMAEGGTVADLTMDKATLFAWAVANADGPVVAAPHKGLSLTSRLVRFDWRGEPCVAVGSDADGKTRINAVVDALAILVGQAEPKHHNVHVIIGTGPEGAADPSVLEHLGAIGTLLASHSGPLGVTAWTLAPGGEPQAFKPTAAAFTTGTPTKWAGMLAAAASASIGGLAAIVAERLQTRPSFALYPKLSSSAAATPWQMRLDGLEIGRVGEGAAVLALASSDLTKPSEPRATWLDVVGPVSLTFGLDDIDRLVGIVDALIERWSTGKKPGAVLGHGQAEHALEAHVLSGRLTLNSSEGPLRLAIQPNGPLLASAQFPTLWGDVTRPARYLDALLSDTDGRPWAIELKDQASGGHGSYLRHGIAQAVLYRHFIKTASQLDGWFSGHGLNRTECRAAVAFPSAAASTDHHIASHRTIAAMFDVEVIQFSRPGES